MGLKGNLSDVKLADVFKMLSESTANGLLRVQAPEGPRYVEIQNGVISIAGRSVEHIRLGNLLLSRGLVDEPKLEQALQIQRENGKLLGQVLIDLDFISLAHLQEALQFQVEEEVHELFMLPSGEFDFLANATLDAKLAPLGGLVRLKIDPNALLVEALRRAGEWREVEKRITSQAMLFQLTPMGQEALQTGEGVSWEGAMLLKLVHAQRTVESLVRKGCLGRLATNQMLIELWDAGLVVPLPLAEYENVAREHLQVKRWEEAQRVACLALANCDASKKKLFQALLSDIEQKRGIKQTTATRLATDYKIRVDVARRASPNLIVARERALWPLLAVALLLVLVKPVAAVYFLYLSPGVKKESPVARADFERCKVEVNELASAGKWKEAFAKFHDFKTYDPDVRKLANEYLKKVQDDFEHELVLAIDEFYKVYDGKQDELKNAADKLEPMKDVPAVDPKLDAERKRASEKWESYHNRQLTAQLKRELKAIQDSKPAKEQDYEALEKSYAAFLAKQPPEELAADVREEARKLYARRKELTATLKLARELIRHGDTEAAKFEFDRVVKLYPQSSLAQQAQAELRQLAENNAPFQRQLDDIKTLVQALRHDEARQALVKFLDTKPPQEFAVQALSILWVLSDTESGLASQVGEAAVLAAKQPHEARQKILELLKQHPYAKALGNATLKVTVQSDPPGVEVVSDNKAAGNTPLTLDLPAVGKISVAFKKAGFETYNYSGYNFRAETLHVTLNRLPVATRRLPAPAQGGLAVWEDLLLAAGGGELAVCGLADLKVENRILLAAQPSPQAEPAGEGACAAALLSADNGQALACVGKQLWLVRLPHGEINRINLGAAAISAPVAFAAPQSVETRWLALLTRTDYECYNAVDGKQIFHTAPFSDAAPEPPCGWVFDGNSFFIPRSTGLVALAAATGKKKPGWKGDCEAKSSGPPAWHCGTGTVALAGVNGRVMVFEADKGALRFQTDLHAPSCCGCAVLGDGFLVLAGGQAVLCSASEDKVLWSTALAGVPVLPLALGAALGAGDKALVCTAQDDEYFINLLSDKGLLLWRAPLYARAAAVASDGKRVFVSTEDADLCVFDLQ